MTDLQIPGGLRELLAQPNPAVVATTRSDGAPVSVATWYLFEGDDRVLLNMDHTRVRLRHLRRDPRVSLTVIDSADWYRHISLVGRVVEMRDDENLADIDRISNHYTGREYSNRTSPRVSAWMEIERWHGWKNSRRILAD